jgi:hypothetical protein
MPQHSTCISKWAIVAGRMRFFLTWLLMLGVVAGLAMRGTGTERLIVSHTHAHEHGHEDVRWHDDHHQHHDHPHDDYQGGDPVQPDKSGHHHQHFVDVVPLPMSPMPVVGLNIVLTPHRVFERQMADLRIPEGPYSEPDSPPLI